MAVFEKLRRKKEAACVGVAMGLVFKTPIDIGAIIRRAKEIAAYPNSLQIIERRDGPFLRVLPRHGARKRWNDRNDQKHQESRRRPSPLWTKQRRLKHSLDAIVELQSP